jgi:hypothetical protein
MKVKGQEAYVMPVFSRVGRLPGRSRLDESELVAARIAQLEAALGVADLY